MRAVAVTNLPHEEATFLLCCSKLSDGFSCLLFLMRFSKDRVCIHLRFYLGSILANREVVFKGKSMLKSVSKRSYLQVYLHDR